MAHANSSRTTLRALVAATVVAGALVLTGVPARAVDPAPAPPPHLVLVLLDDQDATTSPYWDALPRTRALLADRGLTFTNAFAPTPICCPARGTLLTGKYGHNTGVLTNGGPQGGFETFRSRGNEERALPVRLSDAGYRTMLVGKYMNGYESDPTHVPPGWTEWYGAADNLFYLGYNYKLNENGTLVQYGQAEADYSTDVVARKTLDFIERSETDDERPFFAYVASTAPHLPLGPAPRHASNPWTAASVPRTPNFYEADLSDKPCWLRLSGPGRNATQGWNEMDYRNRMGSLLAVDDMVAGIVDTLEANGELDNTYLVFTSDNGYNLGSHRLVHKMVPYEESLRVPLVVSGPGVPHGAETRMALHTDFFPTALDLAGVAIPDDVDGRSLAPVLRGEDPGPWRSDFLAQYAGGGGGNGIGSELPSPVYYWIFVIILGQDVPSYRAVRTDHYTFVEWYDKERYGFHELELYDLSTDPYELQNLLSTAAGRRANRALVQQLRRRMNALGSCSGPSCRG